MSGGDRVGPGPDWGQHLAAVLDEVPVGLLVADSLGRVRDVNRAWMELSGLDHSGTMGNGWLSLFDLSVQRQVLRDLAAMVATGSERVHDYAASSGLGPRWLRWHMRVTKRDADPTIIMAVTELTDSRPGDDAATPSHDRLTGLANKERFLRDIDAALLVHGGPGVVVAVIDIDGFKTVNDSYGAPYGDRLLAAVGRRLQSIARRGDVAARLGSDEFALLWPAFDPAASIQILSDRVRGVFDTPFHLAGATWVLSVSVGVVAARAASTGENLLVAGYRAMYRSKNRDRGATRQAADADLSAGADAVAIPIQTIERAIEDIYAVGLALATCIASVDPPIGDRLSVAIDDLDRVISILRTATTRPSAFVGDPTSHGTLSASEAEVLIGILDHIAATSEEMVRSRIAEPEQVRPLLDSVAGLQTAILQLATSTAGP